MTKRQMAFGVLCFLGGMLVGMERAGNLDVLVGLVIIVAILLLCVYLALPSLPRRTRARPRPAQRLPPRRLQRKAERAWGLDFKNAFQNIFSHPLEIMSFSTRQN